MSNNKVKRLNNLIIALLIILLLTIILSLLADARYQVLLSGTGNASIANWSFKLVDGDISTTDVIDLAVTRTDTNANVVEGKIAPGTCGEIEIGVDARGTETALQYSIDIALENVPKNLVFYANSAKTQVLEMANNNVTKIGYMTLAEVNTLRTEKIYWEWPYETGETEADIIANDAEDTEDAGKDVTMEITVTGTQIHEIPAIIIEFTIAGTAYNAEAGMTWQEWEASDYNANRVISIDTGGSVRSGTVANLYLQKTTGESIHRDMMVEPIQYIFKQVSAAEPLSL